MRFHSISHIARLTFFFTIFLWCPSRAHGDVAAWVVRFDIESQEEIESLCDAAVKADPDRLLVQVRGRADAYYRSRVAPKGERLADKPADFDPLSQVLSSCAPIPVHGWVNVYYLWTGDTPPESPDHPASGDRAWIMEDENGKKLSHYTAYERATGWTEGVYADPGSEEYRDLFVRVVDELAGGYPVGGIHLDFIRYPGFSYGRGGISAERYKNKWGFHPLWLPTDPPDLQRWLNGSMRRGDRLLTTALLLWADHRAEQVTALVRQVRQTLRNEHPGIVLSAAVFPEPEEAYLKKGQDWLAWAEEGLVDELYFMTYYGSLERMERQFEETRQAALYASPKIRPWAGLGAYIKKPSTIAGETELAIRAGISDICLFSLGDIERKETGSGPYFEEIKQAFLSAGKKPSRQGRNPLAPLIAKQKVQDLDGAGLLARAFLRSLPPPAPLPLDFFQKISERWREFSQGGREQVAKALNNTMKSAAQPPPSLEYRGIFRFVHPLDSQEKKMEQREVLEKILTGLEKGESLEKAARRFSQGGSKNYGGRLPVRHLCSLDETDRILAGLGPGEVSPIIEATNGFWIYQVTSISEPTTPATGKSLPWPARRCFLRRSLADFDHGSAGTD